jgi:hypothetical protein
MQTLGLAPKLISETSLYIPTMYKYLQLGPMYTYYGVIGRVEMMKYFSREVPMEDRRLVIQLI